MKRGRCSGGVERNRRAYKPPLLSLIGFLIFMSTPDFTSSPILVAALAITMISLDNAIPYIPPAPSCSSCSNRSCSSLDVQTASLDTFHLQNDFMAWTTMAMPILSIDLTTIPDSEPERRSSLGHKTCPIDPDSLPEMGDTGNAGRSRCQCLNGDDHI